MKGILLEKPGVVEGYISYDLGYLRAIVICTGHIKLFAGRVI